MNEQESQSNDYLRPPLWHGKLAFGKVSLRLTLQKSDASEKSTQDFKHVSLFALDEPFEQKSPVVRRRLLVLGLYLSFLGCVTGLWLTTNVTGDLAHKLPARIVNFIATQPVVVLLVPLLMLLGCYFLLRLMTYEILAWPERFLDERQQMVRDKAHRNAYKIVKVACLLVPLYLCLHAVLWSAQPPIASPVPAPALTIVRPSEYILFVTQDSQSSSLPIIHPSPPQGSHRMFIIQGIEFHPAIIAVYKDALPDSTYALHALTSTFVNRGALATPATPVPVPSSPDNPVSPLLYYGTLLLSLLLMAIALPMSIVAWKERL